MKCDKCNLNILYIWWVEFQELQEVNFKKSHRLFRLLFIIIELCLIVPLGALVISSAKSGGP